MARFLLLSNGHGEDISGALIGKQLQGAGHQVDCLPLVGSGFAYKEAGIRLVGETKEFSTGGLGYTSLQGRLTELLQGQVFYLLRRLGRLLLIAHRYDLLIVIGDVIPVIAAWLTGRPVATYLVAYSSHYEGRLRLPWPCGNCLASSRFLAVYSRDQLTGIDLTGQLKRPVHFLGNPFMDPVLESQARLPICSYRLGLLPGSRHPELEKNILLLLAVVEWLPEHQFTSGKLSLDMALVATMKASSIAALASTRGWKLITGSCHQLVREQRHINLRWQSFNAVLHSSDLLLCMAGTAAEQAVGLAKPVLQLPGQGPQFTASFAEAQRRLLGPTVFCAAGEPGETALLRDTAKLTMELLKRSQQDTNLSEQCHDQAQRRLGSSGGANRLANAITDLLASQRQ
ncbi:MAG: lipid-A-disaccharide synthase-related protein [Prochlorococcaceae cyanobacterium ETNP18_MAG_1]|nr:lipid-A-disaccharide synthase-related protein [Prochlorococcaceae cyanobacterium ETNP18_MAG_1]